MNRATIAIVIAIVALGAALLPLALGGGELGVTNFDSMYLSEDLKVGNGTPSVTLNGEDAFVEGTFEVDGATRFDGAVAINGGLTGAVANDLNGGALTMDADGDTILRAQVDDLTTLVLGAATGTMQVSTGSFRVGNGANTVSLDGEDAYVEGTFEVDGTSNFGGVATFVGDPVLGTGGASAGEVADVVRYVPIPLRSWVDCQTDAGADLSFGSGADALADFINSATDGTGFTIQFDDSGGAEDQGSEICSQVTVPGDYASGGAIIVRALKDAHTAGNTELLTCGASINGAALGVAATTAIGVAATAAYTCTPAGTFAAGDSASLYLSITSGGTMDDTVEIASSVFAYTATQ